MGRLADSVEIHGLSSLFLLWVFFILQGPCWVFWLTLCGANAATLSVLAVDNDLTGLALATTNSIDISVVKTRNKGGSGFALGL
jgi:hypothetical protein